MNENKIIDRISGDLRINPYENEMRTSYVSRVVYSALSMWFRISTLDEDIYQQHSNGVSKIHLRNRCRFFLENMVELYPFIQNWFYPEVDSNPIVTIRDRLSAGGELIEIGFNTNLALPVYQECLINENVGVIRGLKKDIYSKMTGLSQLILFDEIRDLDFRNAFYFYGLQEQTAERTLASYLKNSKWSKQSTIKAQIFKKYSKGSFSNCWDNEYILNENEVSLYRNENYQMGKKDYGFIKKLNGFIYTSQIIQPLIDRFEVRRFLYGLKSSVNNQAVAKYRRYEEDNLVELILYSGLPRKEESILFLLGWPLGNIHNSLNLLFSHHVWFFVKEVLKKLNIDLQEV